MVIVRHASLHPQEDPSFYVEALIDQLNEHPLDRRFEAHGGFIVREAPDLKSGFTRYIGNFAAPYTALHFCIETDHPGTMKRIEEAIYENQAGTQYTDQDTEFCPSLLTVTEHRFSTTQAEVTLVYNGTVLGRFGARVTLDSRGEFSPPPRNYWEWVARRLVIEEAGDIVCL